MTSGFYIIVATMNNNVRMIRRLKRIFSVKTKKAFDKITKKKSIKSLLHTAYLQSKKMFNRKEIISEIGPIIEDNIRYRLCCNAIRIARYYGKIFKNKMDTDMLLILKQTVMCDTKIFKYSCENSLNKTVEWILNEQELHHNLGYFVFNEFDLDNPTFHVRWGFKCETLKIIINSHNWQKYIKIWEKSRFTADIEFNAQFLSWITNGSTPQQIYRAKGRKKIIIDRVFKLYKLHLLKPNSSPPNWSSIFGIILLRDEVFIREYLTKLKRENISPIQLIPSKYRKKWAWYAELDN